MSVIFILYLIKTKNEMEADQEKDEQSVSNLNFLKKHKIL